MLANLKIICRFHAHPVHQNSVDIFGPRYVGDDFLSVETSLLQSNSRSLRDRVVLESNCTEKDYFCCEEMTENNDKKIEVEQANNMTFITHGFRVSVVSDVQERVRDLASRLPFMLRRSSLVECVSVLHGTCLQCAGKKIPISM